MTTIDALLMAEATRHRRASIRSRAADRAQRVGIAASVRRALAPLHNLGDDATAFDRALARNAAHNDLAFRAFAAASRMRHEACAILMGAA